MRKAFKKLQESVTAGQPHFVNVSMELGMWGVSLTVVPTADGPVWSAKASWFSKALGSIVPTTRWSKQQADTAMHLTEEALTRFGEKNSWMTFRTQGAFVQLRTLRDSERHNGAIRIEPHGALPVELLTTSHPGFKYLVPCEEPTHVFPPTTKGNAPVFYALELWVPMGCGKCAGCEANKTETLREGLN